MENKIEQKKETSLQVSVYQKADQLTASFMVKINEMVQKKALKLPPDYSAENAVKSAYLAILEVTDKEKRPALEVTTPASQATALLKMVVQGLTPARTQCYFVIYGDKLTLMRSYHGTQAIAKCCEPRIKDITGNVIYEGDKFTLKIDQNGYRTIEHETKIENISLDLNKIKGAYAICVMEGMPNHIEVMTIDQIIEAWKMGKNYKGKSPEFPGTHNKFSDEMALKTVKGRVCKYFINTSSDAYLYSGTPDDVIDNQEQIEATIDANQGKQLLGFDDAPAIEVKEKQPEIKEQIKAAPAKTTADIQKEIEEEEKRRAEGATKRKPSVTQGGRSDTATQQKEINKITPNPDF